MRGLSDDFGSALARHTARLAVGGLLLSSVVALSAGVAAAGDGKVTLCHRTNSNNNPYVEITVSVNSVIKSSGHDGHNGPVYNPTLKSQHIKWGDIIPAFSGYPGKNLSAAGQAILDRGCNYVGPDLAMDKTGPAGAHPGDTVTYTLTVTNQPGADATYGDITVTDVLPAGLSNGEMTPASNPGDWNCSGLTCTTSTVVIQPGSSVVFTVTATVDQDASTQTPLTDTATVDTPGDTDDSNNTDTADTQISIESIVPPTDLTLSAKCADPEGHVLWTVTNPAGNGTVSNLSASSDPAGVNATPDPSSLDAEQSATFITEPLAPGQTMSVSGDIGEGSVGSNDVAFSDSCTPEVLPLEANPGISGSHACKTGISVVLSNMDGTASARFTVTKPDGGQSVITVRPDSIAKRSYTVKEDTTGVVKVSSAGISSRTFTFKKNCAKVLGEKTVKTPQLPFTGAPTERMVDVALVMLVSGAMLAELGRRRRAAHAQR